MEQNECEISEITKEDCERYEGVRVSGVTNMFMVGNVVKLSGLSRAKVMTIMKNYSQLNDRFEFA